MIAFDWDQSNQAHKKLIKTYEDSTKCDPTEVKDVLNTNIFTYTKKMLTTYYTQPTKKQASFSNKVFKTLVKTSE